MSLSRRTALKLTAAMLGTMKSATAAPAHEMASDLTLWYEHPAAEWTEALPIGNGQMGAMVFGGVSSERLQLNDSTLWAGSPYQPAHKGAAAHLAEARKLQIGRASCRERV